MKNIGWEITQFSSIVSFPSDADSGASTYAQDMVNLRVNRWGHLKLRPTIKAFQVSRESDLQDDAISVVGVASGSRELVWLLSDGRLMITDDMPSSPIEIDDITNLRGLLSMVEISGAKVITAAGNDGGHIIAADAVQTLGNRAVESLSLEAPQESDFTIALGAGLAEIDDEYTYYRLAFAGEGELGNVESETFRHAIKLRRQLAVQPDTEVLNPDHENYIPTAYNVQFRLNTKPADSRITHLNIYRSAERQATDDALDDNILYYRVASLPLAESASNFPQAFRDRTPKSQVNVAFPLLDNTRMPSEVEQIALYNDNFLFGAADNQLRFTDFRYGTPYWYAWGKTNALATGQRIEFCAEYRGMLLFGASDNLYRLSGTSIANFRFDQISSRGPVTPHAWAILDKAFAFVGSDGFYFTDGTQAPEIAPQLKGYFNRYDVEGGFVGMLPHGASLWGVNRRNKSTGETDNLYFVNDGRDWMRVAEGSDSTHIQQYTALQFDGLSLSGIIADQQRAPRVIDWVVDDETVDGLTKYTGQDNAPTEAIDWSWESQQLDWNSEGLGEQMKIFNDLRISGYAENDVTVTFYIDERDPITETVTLDRSGNTRFDPLRIRIERRGFGIRFKLSGTGDVTLRGLRLGAVA